MLEQGDSPMHDKFPIAPVLKTTVIIPCHNYGQFLSWAIASVLHQSRPAKEILVVDDSSTDNTPEVAASYKDLIRYFRVDFRCAQQTRNFGLDQASGEYILFLDADDFLDNQALELLEDALGSDDSLKLVYSGRYHFGAPQTIGELGFEFSWIPESFDLDRLRQANYISMPSLFRKSGFPGFDPKIKRFQDWEAWLSFLSSNTDAKCIPIPLHHVRFHGQNKTLRVESYSERFKVLTKHGLFKINSSAKGALLPINIKSANKLPPIKIFIVAISLEAEYAPLLIEFVHSAVPAVCGMVVQANSADVFAHIERAAQDVSVPVTLIQAENLDALLKAAMQQPAYQEAEWLVIGNFSSIIRIDEIVRHHGTLGAVIVTPTIFDWSLGLAQAPFVAFNRQAARELFGTPSVEVTRTKRDRIDRVFLRTVSVLWGRYIGWRLHAKVKANDSKN